MSSRAELLRTTLLRFAVLGFALIISVLVARSLGPEARGTYQLVLTSSLIVASVGGLSGELGFAALLGRGQEFARDRVLATLGYGSILWGAFLGVATLAVGYGVQAGDALDFQEVGEYTALLLLAGFVVTSIINTWLQRALNLQGRASAAAACSLAEVSLTLAVVLCGLAVGQLTVLWVLIGALAGSATAAGGAVAAARAPVRSLDLGVFVRGVGEGLRFHISQVALQLLMRLDILLLGILAGVASVGQYAVALSITAPLVVLANAVTSTFLRHQFVESDSESAEATLELFGVTSVLVGSISVLVGVVGWFTVPIVWGAAFEESKLILLMLLPGVMAHAAQRPLGQFFVRNGAARVMTSRVFVALAVNTGLDLVLIPSYGALGAALASSVAYLSYAGISLHYFMKTTKISGRDIVKEFANATRTIRPARSEGASDD